MAEKSATATYRENFEALKNAAETLRRMQEPDIDSLVPLVDGAMKNYTVCSERIAAVRKMLNEKLPPELAAIGG